MRTKHFKALIQQGRVTRSVTQLLGYSDPEIAAAWIEGDGGTATLDAVKSRPIATPQKTNASH
jgi:hypothetical protein